MSGLDLIVTIAFAFVMGGCFGGLVMNNVCWRSQRTRLDQLSVESDQMFADLRQKYDAYEAKWDGVIADLRQDGDARQREYKLWKYRAVAWCQEHAHDLPR